MTLPYCMLSIVYPACAGIHLEAPEDRFQAVSLPRMRGDPPRKPRTGSLEPESTPHARGSTLQATHFLRF